MLREIIVLILFVSSGFFFTVGTLGLLRMPDVFTRMHASTKCDTLGAGLALLGVTVYAGFSMISIKAVVIMAFIWITKPTTAHAIGKAKYMRDHQ